ncbi:hypothetical protein ES703_57039 [subsurface metagenome]
MDSLDRILGWLPQNPLLGPPLPAWLNIFWPEPEKEKPEPPGDYAAWAGPVPRKRYVTRVTIRKVRKGS